MNKPKRFFKEEEIQYIISSYAQGRKCPSLGKEFGVTRNRIRKILNKHNISTSDNIRLRNRKYEIDETFFERINTKEKAYFLGLLYSDGCNSRKGFKISIQNIDNKIIYEFKKSLKYSGKCSIYKPVRPKDKQDIITLHVSNIKMSEDLYKLGCVPSKSLILKFPTEDQVPKHLLKFFILGYFDGDGGISLYSNKKGRALIEISFTSTVTFCKALNNYLEKELGIKMSTRIYPNMITAVLKLGSKSKTKILLDWLYRDAPIYMERKYQKYKKFYEL